METLSPSSLLPLPRKQALLLAAVRHRELAALEQTTVGEDLSRLRLLLLQAGVSRLRAVAPDPGAPHLVAARQVRRVAARPVRFAADLLPAAAVPLVVASARHVGQARHRAGAARLAGIARLAVAAARLAAAEARPAVEAAHPAVGAARPAAVAARPAAARRRPAAHARATARPADAAHRRRGGDGSGPLRDRPTRRGEID